MRGVARFLDRLPEHAIVGLVAVMAVLINLEVVFRYFLQSSLGWVEEGARLTLTWLTFLGAAVAVRRRAHFHLSLVADRLSPGPRRVVRAASSLIVAVFSAVLTWFGAMILPSAWVQRYHVLGLSVGWAYLAIPVGGALMLIYATLQLVEVLRPGSEEGAVAAPEPSVDVV